MYFAVDIEKETRENEDYRRVLFTPGNLQLVLMSIPVGEDIELEIHPDVDQFFRIESGEGEIRIGKNQDNVIAIKDGSGVIITHGTFHRVINTGNKPLKLYTIYSPPNHPKDKVEHVKPKETPILTGNINIDLKILSELDDKDLFNFCISKPKDEYYRNLCNNENFWQNRLKSRFPKFVNTSENRNWKKTYLRIVYENDKIFSIDPDPEMIKLKEIQKLSEEGMKNFDLINYFIAKMKQTGYNEYYIMPYGFTGAVISGDKELINFYIKSKYIDKYNWRWALNFSKDKGREDLVDYFTKKILEEESE